MAAGGAAVYHAGKSSANRANHEAEQDAAIEGSYQQQAAPPPPPAPAAPAPGGMSQSAIDSLKQLGQLHDEGVLTDEEFEAQKAKVLNG
jgi:Short C-terminal domain